MPQATRDLFANYRPVSIGSAPVVMNCDGNGVWHLASREPLESWPDRMTDKLVEGAKQYPDRTLIARRGADGEWNHLSYADVLERVRAIGQALLQRDLSAERPIMILSGNDLEHFQLSLGAMYAGIPHCAVSPNSSLLSSDFAKLKHMAGLLTPGLVYASDGGPFARAITTVFPEDVEIVLAAGEVPGRTATPLAELQGTPATEAIDAAHQAVGPDTVAKFLFTSGSTKLPKAVTTTQRMLCANQQMLLQTFPCFGEEPPVLLDWLPWNHTFGGSHNLGIALYNGGTYYINDGKPTDKGFAETLRNLKEISPTVFFDVPKGWELLADALDQDEQLCEIFFAKMKLFFFAGAGLSQAVWDHLDRLSEAHCGGKRIRVMTGLGMTETSPSSTFSTGPLVKAGYVGLPAPGCEMKLVPVDGKLEARFRGPHVMPGYWRQPEQTQEAFDEEGYYCTGDALAFFDPSRPEIGLMFDGRIAEDFKLSSGTFVSVGRLRAHLIATGAPYVQDAVITGMNRDDVGAMVFPRMEHCLKLSGLPTDADAQTVLDSPAVIEHFTTALAEINAAATGSASRIAFLHLLVEPPSVDAHEITDKGSINQRAVLTRRAGLVDALYEGGEVRMIRA